MNIRAYMMPKMISNVDEETKMAGLGVGAKVPGQRRV